MVLLIFTLSAGVFVYQKLETERKDMQVTLYGNVDTRQVTLGFRVPGRIQQIMVDEGDKIHAGDVVAILDTAPYQAELALSKAKLSSANAELLKLRNGYRKEEITRAKAAEKEAEARLKNAAIQHARNEKLLKGAVIAQKEVDISLADRDQASAALDLKRADLALYETGYRAEDIAAAEAQVEAAQASVKTCELNLQDCSLTAPESGIVQIRSKEPGAMVSSGMGILTETLDSTVWVRAYVAEPLLGKISSGMEVDIYTDSEPGQQAATGKIGFISPVAEFTPKSVETATLRTDLVYRIRIVVERGTEKLLQGMPVTIKIPVQ